MSSHRYAQAGFTLAEIAIVMVIIGLLLGGVMRGQEMVTQARIKNVIADFSGMTAVYHSYRDRYGKIPGDDPCAGGTVNAVLCGTTTGRWTGATPGDGNGQIAGKYNSATATDESRLWWDHLRRAGFVSGGGDLQPSNALAGMIGVQTGNSAGGAAFGAFIGTILCSANISDKIAIAVDVQMDDGAPASGTLRARVQSTPNPDIVAGTTAAVSYAETGTNAYTVCSPL